ncbi:unannotated protein [freshwater metagenome]|uniref:Unannotated protein n=1 Tax=freshwater metagenome TaxID=449393 RepID=A0A6J6NA07_9ZZZZ|nr:hypothetical protein [Actinomycetota bacterium]
MIDAVRDFWLALHKNDVELRTVINLAETARRAIRSYPKPEELPPWVHSARPLIPSVEFVLPCLAMRLAFRDPVSRAVRQQQLFVNTFATPTTNGIVVSFEFMGTSKSGRRLCNSETREWLHQNAAAIQDSLSDYYSTNQILIHQHWRDTVMRHQLHNLDCIATLHLGIEPTISAFTLLNQTIGSQIQYLETAGLLSIPP